MSASRCLNHPVSPRSMQRCLRTHTHSILSSRLYHSRDHPSTSGAFNQTERAILSAAYAHVPEHGFSQHALNLGAQDTGYPTISTNILAGGPYSLIQYHLTTRREALAPRSRELFSSLYDGSAATGANDINKAKVAERVEVLVWERLLGNMEVIHRWQEALAVMAQPTHVPASLRELALLSDEIYHLAGDKSVDPSWYTKRGSLSAIYASSELFMTNDSSPGYGETRAFLQRRLHEASGVASLLGNIGHWGGFTASAAVNVLRSKGLRM